MLCSFTRRIAGICVLVTLFATLLQRSASAVTLAWDASADAATGKVAGYRVYYSAQIYSVLPADVATNPAFTKIDAGNQTSVSVTSLVSGTTYYFGVTAYDSNGVESGLSNVLPYNDSPPTVSLTSPSANASFLTTDTVTIAASASSFSSSIAKIDFFDGATLLGSKTLAPYTLAQSFSAGSHTLTARATDANNKATASAAVTINVSVPVTPPPNVPPTVAITAPASNASFIFGTVIPIAASAADSDGTIARVDFYDGSSLIASATTTPYSVATSTLSLGTHSLTAKATDNAGAVTTSAAVAISVIANQSPTVALTGPANNATFLTNALVTIAATASDSDGGIARVDFYDGATLLGSSTTSPYTFATATLAQGTHSLTATATDNMGATATSTVTTVTIAIAANQVPTVSITSPVKSSVFLTTDTITITAKASDTDGSIVKVDFLDGTTLLGTATTSPYSVAATGLAVGTHTLKAKATDNSGAATTSRGVSITVKANSAPTVALTSPADGAAFATNAAITLTASASDSDGTVASVDFFDGAVLLGTVTTSPYSLVASFPGTGTHVLSARATDNNGLSTTSASATISVIANTSPTVALTGLTPGSRLSQPVVLNAAASEPGATITQVEFFAGTNSLGVVTAAPYTISTSMSSGTFAFTAKATDNFGSVGVSPAITATVKPGGPKSLTVK